MRPEVRIKNLLSALQRLVADSERVSGKYGMNEDVPSDWNEWVDLRRAIMEAKHAIARETK